MGQTGTEEKRRKTRKEEEKQRGKRMRAGRIGVVGEVSAATASTRVQDAVGYSAHRTKTVRAMEARLLRAAASQLGVGLDRGKSSGKTLLVFTVLVMPRLSTVKGGGWCLQCQPPSSLTQGDRIPVMGSDVQLHYKHYSGPNQQGIQGAEEESAHSEDAETSPQKL